MLNKRTKCRIALVLIFKYVCSVLPKCSQRKSVKCGLRSKLLIAPLENSISTTVLMLCMHMYAFWISGCASYVVKVVCRDLFDLLAHRSFKNIVNVERPFVESDVLCRSCPGPPSTNKILMLLGLEIFFFL